ncbi:MAG: putative ABC exporter domain-containing protein, partial [Clostridium sp.]|nr:putative ABC exporter domain-containing protein [Clostridium sp.]
MKAILYLLRKGLKNTVLEILHKPAKAVLWGVVLVLMIMMVLLAVFGQKTNTNVPIEYIKTGLFVGVTLLLVSSVHNGLASGSAIFDMCDVNLLFPSVIDSGTILVYGVLRLAKSSLLMVFVILFQMVNFNNMGIPPRGVLILCLGAILGMCLFQIVTLIIYTFTNSRPKRKRVVKILTTLIFVPIFVVFASIAYRQGLSLGVLKPLVASPVYTWTPFVGWVSGGIAELIFGSTSLGILLFAILVVSIVLCTWVIIKSTPDYYEDVLVATETAFERKRSLTEGNINALRMDKNKRHKVRGEGIGGIGAAAFFNKHLREAFRTNRLGLWGVGSIVSILCGCVFAFILRDKGLFAILATLGFLMYMGMLTTGGDAAILELFQPFIYLVPQAPLSKIIWCCVETLLKKLGEGLVLFVAIGLISDVDLGISLLCAFIYVMYSLLTIGINFFCLRFTGQEGRAGLVVMLYMFAII